MIVLRRREAGVPTSVVDAVFAARAPSTMTSWPATFARMYLDRARELAAQTIADVKEIIGFVGARR